MSEWRETTLSEVCSEISYGYTESAKLEKIGPKFLRITDIANGRINWDNVPYCPITNENFVKYKLVPGDIVIARTGATTGANYTIKEGDPTEIVFASYLIRYKIDKKKANPYFIGHILKSFNWKDYVDAIAGGSAQPGANAKQLGSFEISLPSLPEQTSIASILSSLDDKIDLLHRQNATLEKMAETLFRQWFVEEAKEEWEYQLTLGDLIESVSITHKFPNNMIVFLNTSDIYLGNVIEHNLSLVKGLPGQAKKSIQKGDILFSEIRPANGRWAYIDFDAANYVVSTKLMVLRSKNILSQEFIYFYLTNRSTVDWLQLIAESRSGTFPQITFDQIKDLKINIPSETVLKDSIIWCESALKKIHSNQTQIRTLTAIRNNLLPKLMSGEVLVKM